MKRKEVLNSSPLQVIHRLIQERYSDASAIFWSGSLSRNEGTLASDIDLIVIYNDSLPRAYKESFKYQSYPIDVFVYDKHSLLSTFQEAQKIGILGPIAMIQEGVELVISSDDFSQNIKTIAQQYFIAGPVVWSENRINKERFLITDILDDVIYSASSEEQIASAVRLYEILAQFYFRSRNKWFAEGKAIVRYLKCEDSIFAAEFIASFDLFFKTREVVNLKKIAQQIVEPFGGFLWDGFVLDFSKN